jgi:hypothetical protein
MEHWRTFRKEVHGRPWNLVEVLEGDGRMEGSRIFLTSTVYNKLTLRFKEKKATPPFHFYPFLRHPLIRPFVVTPPFTPLYPSLCSPPLNLKW